MRNNSIWVSGSGDVVLKISYLELWPPSCSLEPNHLCNFERGHHGEHSCEDQWEHSCEVMKFGPVVQEEMSFKRFLIWSSGGPPVQWSGTIYAMLKEGIMGTIHVSYMKFRPVVQEMLFKEKVYGWTDDGQRPITIPHLEPSAQVS